MSTGVDECNQRVYRRRSDHTMKEFFESVGVFDRILLGTAIMAFIGVIVAVVMVWSF